MVFEQIMYLRTPLTITNCAAAADGGTLVLFVRDADGHRHSVTMTQHAFLTDYAPDRIPGRLYWDDELLAIRSSQEFELIRALELPAIDYLPLVGEPGADESHGDVGALPTDVIRDDLLHAVAEIRAFVSSEKYLQVAKQLGEE